MSAYYVVRFVAGVPLNERKHSATLGRFATPEEADSARMRWLHPQDLQVLRREQAGDNQ